MKIDKVLDDKLEKSFEVVIPFADVEEKIKTEAEKKQKNYRLDGFRIGKVPVTEIIRREKTPLFYQSSDELISELVNNIIKENNYKLSSQADIDFTNFKEDEDIVLKINLELIPDVGDIDLSKINLVTYKVDVNDEIVQDSFKRAVDRNKKLKKAEKSAENNDTVNINFEGFVNDQAFDGGKGENFKLKIGSHTFIDGFEEQLIGKKAGDKVDVNVKFPDNYHSSQLAGKDALFKVEVLEVLIPDDTEVDDVFIKNNFGIDTVEKFKELLKKEIENSYSAVSFNKTKEKLIDELDKDFDFELPKKLLSKRIDALKKYRKDDKEEDLEKEAKKTLKCSFILSSIADKNNIKVNNSEITEAVMREASQYAGKEKQIIDIYKNNQGMLDMLSSQILEDKIIKYILDNVTKIEKVVTIEEFEKI